MQTMLKGEMTKRLLRCYPGGSANDKQPVANELSMLTFYLNTRPAKIRKASEMLCSKAHNYTRSDPGNFNCTVLIMLEIITKLHEHFPLFAEPALEIIDVTIDKVHGNQTVYLEQATALLTAFNRYHKGINFLGHPTFANRFLSVTKKMSDIATNANPAMRLLAIKSLESYSQSPALATNVGQKALPIAVRGVQVNIPRDVTFYTHSRHAKNDKDQQFSDPGIEALKCIQKFLDVDFFDQIITVVNSILAWVVTLKQENWEPLLIAAIPKWVPPQSRFIVTQTVVAAMYTLPPEAIREATIYSGYVDQLLTADETKIGLSSIDVLRKFVRIQHRLVVSPPPSAGPDAIQNLIAKLRQNIRNLVKLNTYPGQTNDMIAELLRRYDLQPRPISRKNSFLNASDVSVANSFASDSESKTQGASSPIGVIVNDFCDLLDIMDHQNLETQRKPVVDLWEGTQWLLTSHNPQILMLYVQCFQKFLENAQMPTVASAEQGLIIQSLIKTLNQKLDPINHVSIYYALLSYLEFLGDLSDTALPWIAHLLLENDGDHSTTNGNTLKSSASKSSTSKLSTPKSSSDSFNSVCTSSVGLGAFLCIFKNTGRDEPAKLVFELIEDRVSRSLWLPGITYPLATSSERTIAAVAAQTDIVFGAATDLSVSLDKLALTPEEQISIRSPPPSPSPPTPYSQELMGAKLRASTRSLRSNVRNFTTESYASFTGSQLPGVSELRRRETDALSTHTTSTSRKPVVDHRKLPNTSQRDSVATITAPQIDVLSVVGSVSRRGVAKGSLTT